MNTNEVLKLALEALEAIGSQYVCRSTHHTKAQQHHGYEACPNELTHEAAITALQEALADQPAQQDAKLYTSPPAQRTWVGLADEEVQEIWDAFSSPASGNIVRNIEAKLKEKNT